MHYLDINASLNLRNNPLLPTIIPVSSSVHIGLPTSPYFWMLLYTIGFVIDSILDQVFAMGLL